MSARSIYVEGKDFPLSLLEQLKAKPTNLLKIINDPGRNRI